MINSESVSLSVWNHSLRFSFAEGQKHIDFHDTIKKGKARYYLFHEKTMIVKDAPLMKSSPIPAPVIMKWPRNMLPMQKKRALM